MQINKNRINCSKQHSFRNYTELFLPSIEEKDIIILELGITH